MGISRGENTWHSVDNVTRTRHRPDEIYSNMKIYANGCHLYNKELVDNDP